VSAGTSPAQRFAQFRSGSQPVIPPRRAVSLSRTDSYSSLTHAYPPAIFQSSPSQNARYTPSVASPLASSVSSPLPEDSARLSNPAPLSPLTPLLDAGFPSPNPHNSTSNSSLQILGVRRSISVDSDYNNGYPAKRAKATPEEARARKAEHNATRATLSSFRAIEGPEVHRCVSTAYDWYKVQCLLFGPYFDDETRASMPQQALSAALEKLHLPSNHVTLDYRMGQFVRSSISRWLLGTNFVQLSGTEGAVRSGTKKVIDIMLDKVYDLRDSQLETDKEYNRQRVAFLLKDGRFMYEVKICLFVANNNQLTVATGCP
jgi:hypothetical protein